MGNEGHQDVWLLANFQMHRWPSSGRKRPALVALAFPAASQRP